MPMHRKVSADNVEVPMHSDTESPHVHFDESIFNVEESTALEARFAASFENAPHDIHLVNTGEVPATYDCSHVRPSSESRTVSPLGFCVDIGALKSVVGQNQLKHTLQYIDRSSIPRMHSNNNYRFGDVTVRTVGTVEIMLATPPTVPDIPVLMDIVPANVPALLGLDILDSEQLYADNVTNRLVHRHVVSNHNGTLQYVDKWHVPYPAMTTISTQQFRSRIFSSTPPLSWRKCTGNSRTLQPASYSTSSRGLARRRLTRKHSTASATSSQDANHVSAFTMRPFAFASTLDTNMFDSMPGHISILCISTASPSST